MRPGHRLGEWRLVGRLGAGAFGTTWAASGPEGEAAAVKILEEPPGEELRALARICHPGVARLLGSGARPVPHLVMELVDGPTLDRLSWGPDEAELGQLLAGLADALAAVHDAGLAHGDLKPANVLVPSPRRPVLVDFGMTGHRLGGTLAWAAPERTRGAQSSPAADVYALGLMAWQLLHGRLPFAEEGLTEALLRRRRGPPAPARGSPWLRELLRAMLEVAPEDRPDAAQLADRLADRGFDLPEVGPGLVARRLSAAQVLAGGLGEALHGWLAEGGTLSLIGPEESGRSHAARWAAREAGAQGLPVARLGGDWGSILQLLGDERVCPPLASLPPEPDRELRAGLVASYLQQRGHEGLVLIADDLDRAPGATRSVARAIAGLTSLPLLTTGSEPLDGATAFTLKAWGEVEVAELITAALGRVSDPGGLARAVSAASGGRPGVASRLLVEAVRAGALVQRDHRWLLDLERFPRAVEAAASRIPPLGSRALELLALLAASARPLAAPDLSRALGWSRAELRVAAGDLIGANLVREAPPGLAVRPPVRCAVLAERPPDEGTWRALVDLLERSEAPAPEIAAAAAELGDAERLLAVGPRAVRELGAVDTGEAVRLARRMRGVVDHPALRRTLLLALSRDDDHEAVAPLGPEHVHDHPDDREVRVAVSRALILTGDPGAGLALLGDAEGLAADAARALAWARAGRADAAAAASLSDPPDDPALMDAWFDRRVQLAQALMFDGRVEAALERLEIPDGVAGASAGYAKLLATRGRVLFQEGSIRSAAQAFLAASRVEAGLPRRQAAIVLNNAAVAFYLSGQREQAIASWEQAALQFERMAHDPGVIMAQVNLCNALREDGRWERARRCGIRAWELARALGQHAHAATAAGNLGDLGMVRERWVDAESWFDRADQVAEEHALVEAQVELARRRAELALRRGDEGVGGLIERAILLAEQHDQPLEGARARALAALDAARAGRPHADLAEAALEPLRERGAARELARARCWVAEAHAAAGRPEEALDLARRALSYARDVGDVPVREHAEALERRTVASTRESLRDPRVESLLDLAVAVTRETDPAALLRRVAEATREVTGAERAFVYLREEGAPRLEAAVGEGLEPGPSGSILRRALDGREVVETDVAERGDLQAASSVRWMALRAVVCLPIIDQGQVLGAIYADSRQAGEAELHQMARLLRALAAQAGVAVHNARRLAEASDRARELAELAHDLRAPFSTMAMLVDSYGDRQEPWFAELSGDLRELAERGQQMIREHLGELRRAEQVELLALCRRCAGLTRHAADRVGVRIVVTGAESEVRASAVQLARVLDNLVGNALKYAPPESEVELTVGRAAAEAVVTVADRGPGLGGAERDELFQHGVQGPDAKPGHGLGLAACRRIVRRLGGSLEAADREGGGALLRVRLPR